jgi:nitroreductase
MKGYCIVESDGYPVFDLEICNTCQKCVAICPSLAIMVNNTYSDKIVDSIKNHSIDLLPLLEKRRSIKHFTDKSIPREILDKILSVAKYAPNQNKNISILVIDERGLLGEIDAYAISFVKQMHRMLFGFKPFTLFCSLFYGQMTVIKKKMEYDLNVKRHVIKENTQALIILTGNKWIATTFGSSIFMLATMQLMAESLGVGSCPMDSLLLTLNGKRRLRKKLKIEDNVLGVLSLGYSSENIVNIPRGYEAPIRWNMQT